MKKNLIIEENQGIAQLIQRWFEEGYVVEIAGNDWKKSLRNTGPDIAIINYLRSDCSGVEAVRDIKNTLPTTKVVVITGWPDPSIEKDLTRAGADRLLFKPFELEELSRVVNTLLS